MERNLTTFHDLASPSKTCLIFGAKRAAEPKLALLLTLSLLLVGMAGRSAGRGLPAHAGIVNFGQINVSLFRGAQPDEAAIQSLKRLGVKTIINLRMAGDTWKQEAELAQANGISYTNVPFKGMGRPMHEQITRTLALIQSSPGPVFVHCRHGCDRTGTIIACYRIEHDGWSSEAALEEARRYGMSKLERGMRAYVIDFARKAQSTESRPKLAAAATHN